MREFDLAELTPPLRVPRLTAGPVILRPFGFGDMDLVHVASADPQIAAITSVPRDDSLEAGGGFIERQQQRAADGDGFSFVIADVNEPGQGLGSIGLWLQEIESGRASVGYWLVAAARGRGLAGHALRAVCTFAFENLAIPRVHLFVEPWNVASARTAEFAGFRREATLRGWERINGAQKDADCYAQLHSDWVPG